MNFVATTIEIENQIEKMSLLYENYLKERALRLLELLDKQIELLKIREDIQKKVKNEIDQQQREYYLNNQLKTIQEELGMNSEDDDISELIETASKKDWPQQAAQAFDKEIKKLEKINPSSPDYSIQYGYLSLYLELPWNECTEDNLDLIMPKRFG